MKNHLFKFWSLCTVCTLFVVEPVFAQTISSVRKPVVQPKSQQAWTCGTVVTPEHQEQLQRWLEDGTWDTFRSRNLSGIRGTITIKTTFHVVQEDNGSGNTCTESQCEAQIAELNVEIADSGVEFCIDNILYHQNSDFTTVQYSDSSTYPTIGFVQNTMNVYIVPTVVGAGGFASFPPNTTFVLDDYYMAPGLQVFKHEVGHFFNLLHTHETAFGNECVDGSNCSSAGDLICDTPADTACWDGFCGHACQGETDSCNGDPYDPDGTNFMSYAGESCIETFTPEQLSVIASTAETSRANLQGLCTAARFDFPDGLPFEVDPTEPTTISFEIVEGNETPIPSSAIVILTVNGTEETIGTTSLGGGQYEVTLPGFNCGDEVSFYFEVQGDGGTFAFNPEDAPIDQHPIVVGTVHDEVILSQSFSTGYPSDWSVSGLWTITWFCAPNDDCDGGPYAYFGNAANCTYNVSNDQVSGSVITPEISIAGYEGEILLSFCNALQTESIVGGDYDVAELFVNGSLVQRLEDSLDWEILEFELSDIEGDTVQIEWRFDSVDGENNNFRGWHFDGVKIVSRTVECQMPDPTGACCVEDTCSILTQVDCSGSNGEYLGNDSSCDGEPCAFSGACCIDTNCSVMSQSDCDSSNGLYFGDDSSCASETCGDCVVSDDFGAHTGLWLLDAVRPEIMNVSDSNNRLDFWSPSENIGHLDAMAVAISDGWKVDMTQDWAVSADWHINPPTPDYGDVGEAFVLVLEGDMDNFYIGRGYSIGGGVAYDPAIGFVDNYESTNLWYDGERVGQTEYPRSYIDNTTYIWYVASEQRIYYNDALYVPFDSGVSLAGLSTETEAWVGIGGYSFGLVPEFTTDSLWSDNVCVIDGNIILESTCPADLNDDMVVDVSDLLLVIDAWGSTSGNADINEDGIVDVGDLLEIVGTWGPCS